MWTHSSWDLLKLRVFLVLRDSCVVGVSLCDGLLSRCCPRSSRLWPKQRSVCVGPWPQPPRCSTEAVCASPGNTCTTDTSGRLRGCVTVATEGRGRSSDRCGAGVEPVTSCVYYKPLWLDTGYWVVCVWEWNIAMCSMSEALLNVFGKHYKENILIGIYSL